MVLKNIPFQVSPANNFHNFQQQRHLQWLGWEILARHDRRTGSKVETLLFGSIFLSNRSSENVTVSRQLAWLRIYGTIRWWRCLGVEDFCAKRKLRLAWLYRHVWMIKKPISPTWSTFWLIRWLNAKSRNLTGSPGQIWRNCDWIGMNIFILFCDFTMVIYWNLVVDGFNKMNETKKFLSL